MLKRYLLSLKERICDEAGGAIVLIEAVDRHKESIGLAEAIVARFEKVDDYRDEKGNHMEITMEVLDSSTN